MKLIRSLPPPPIPPTPIPAFLRPIASRQHNYPSPTAIARPNPAIPACHSPTEICIISPGIGCIFTKPACRIGQTGKSGPAKGPDYQPRQIFPPR